MSLPSRSFPHLSEDEERALGQMQLPIPYLKIIHGLNKDLVKNFQVVIIGPKNTGLDRQVIANKVLPASTIVSYVAQPIILKSEFLGPRKLFIDIPDQVDQGFDLSDPNTESRIIIKEHETEVQGYLTFCTDPTGMAPFCRRCIFTGRSDINSITQYINHAFEAIPDGMTFHGTPLKPNCRLEKHIINLEGGVNLLTFRIITSRVIKAGELLLYDYGAHCNTSGMYIQTEEEVNEWMKTKQNADLCTHCAEIITARRSLQRQLEETRKENKKKAEEISKLENQVRDRAQLKGQIKTLETLTSTLHASESHMRKELVAVQNDMKQNTEYQIRLQDRNKELAVIINKRKRDMDSLEEENKKLKASLQDIEATLRTKNAKIDNIQNMLKSIM